MKYKIYCSIGEVVDKYSILNIKLKKITDENALNNITNEIKAIKADVPLVETNDELFDDIYKINLQLWNLEDLIREKSINNEFDKQYIQLAEKIHKTNDKRYNIKKQINIKYNSDLFEEKSYLYAHSNKEPETPEPPEPPESSETLDPTQLDHFLLEKGKHLYTVGSYSESYSIIHQLINKYNNYKTENSFYIDLLFSYENITSIFNYKNFHYNKIKNIMSNIDNLSISTEQKTHTKTHWATYCLHRKNYNEAHSFINYINDIDGPNVNRDNMSFFSDSDINKTLLLYDGGGIGDKIMFSRFITIVCEKYKNNNIILFVDDNIVYLLNKLFNNIINIRVVSYSMPFMIGNYDYHCSFITLMKYLNITYEEITFYPLFKSIDFTNNSNIQRQIIQDIKSSKKLTYIFNWKGNIKNPHELHNRSMKLNNAIPLFNISNIDWIVITKNITTDEKQILDQHNVKYYGDVLDNKDNCFEDSIEVIKNVDGFVSTDTSLVHLSANLDIKTYVLLTSGCEWRWTSDDKYTNWYPDATLLRQQTQGDWSNVINELSSILLPL